MTEPTRYCARTVEEIRYKSAWNYLRVGVFRRAGDSEVEIGESVRNYPTRSHSFAAGTLRG